MEKQRRNWWRDRFQNLNKRATVQTVALLFYKVSARALPAPKLYNFYLKLVFLQLFNSFNLI